jgi:dGTPase
MNRMQTEQDYNYCALPLASYACRPDQSLGRLYDEPESKTRTCFQRDRDRIIHSSAFRHLKYKTQVFITDEGDNYRTRLTHTLEVAQIARSLARALMVNEDLAEVVALAHDLGHPPFAHMGEDALIEAMAPYGGFEHNDQSLRIVTSLEQKYPEFDGLNLTWETLEGIVKHNGPLEVAPEGLPYTLKSVLAQTDLRIDTYPSLEAQIAALSDDIAYNNHDVEDGLNAGLFQIDDLSQLELMGEIIAQTREKWADLEPQRFMHQIIREMIGRMVIDVFDEAKRRLAVLSPQDIEDIRNADKMMIAFSNEMYPKVQELRRFLFERMYHHYSVRRMRSRAMTLIDDLFELFLEDPKCLPTDWQLRYKKAGDQNEQARVVSDYIASMTDRKALSEHKDIFDIYHHR